MKQVTHPQGCIQAIISYGEEKPNETEFLIWCDNVVYEFRELKDGTILCQAKVKSIMSLSFSAFFAPETKGAIRYDGKFLTFTVEPGLVTTWEMSNDLFGRSFTSSQQAALVFGTTGQ